MIKTFHFALAFLTASGFIIRLGWSYVAPDLLTEKWVRIAPHVVDTLLLVMGLWLAFQLAGGAWQGWLIAKMIGLLAYIGFGVLALRGQGVAKAAGAAGALLSVAYIFLVAFTRNPLPGA